MPTLTTRGRAAAGVTLVAVAAGVGVSVVPPSAPRAATVPTTTTVPAVAHVATAAGVATASTRATSHSRAKASAKATTAIAHLTTVARHRYATEVGGSVAHATTRRVARDPGLLRTLQSGNLAATRAYVAQRFPSVWYHWHVSRLRILRGSRVVAEAGVPFVVAPSQVTLRSSGGRTLGTLQVSIQDQVGFVRFMHRNYPVDVVVRGQGSGHMRTSLPAAGNMSLPSNGPATIAGRRYQVRSFSKTGWGGEPIKIWILGKG